MDTTTITTITSPDDLEWVFVRLEQLYQFRDRLTNKQKDCFYDDTGVDETRTKVVESVERRVAAYEFMVSCYLDDI